MDNPWEEVDYEFVPCDECDDADACEILGCAKEDDDD